MRILLAEDERDLCDVVARKLADEGYAVDSCYDGETAYDYARACDYDAVILDVMMPRLDGFALLERLRADGVTAPVLFLTARDAVSDRVKGLDLGANDYLVKPFAFDELLARLRVLTRKHAGAVTDRFACADLVVDCAARTVRRGEEPVALTSREFAVLEYLIRNQGRVLSREAIENHVWNFDYAGGTNVVDVYIRCLRKKIDERFEPKLLHTVRGSGYVLRDSP